MEMASSAASVCIPQASSPIMVLMTRTGSRGMLKDAQLPTRAVPLQRSSLAFCRAKSRTAAVVLSTK